MSLDIYFDLNYGKLYEKIENGKAVDYHYDGPEGQVSHLFLLRKIPIQIDGSPWFDLVTPYGYGGPLIESVAQGYRKEELTAAFEKKFSAYCQTKKIVSEYVRFYPLISNAMDFCRIYHIHYMRNTLGTNLRAYDDPINQEFSRGCRKNIRRAIRKGVTWRVTPKPEQIDVFKDIYYSTMDRNHAADYYYFDDEYFQMCLEKFKEHMLFVEAIYHGETIAAGLYFTYNKIIHIHLSGTRSEYLYLSPAYILRYAVTCWGKENGYELIHHGGGRSNSSNDSLYLFKKQFAQNTEFASYHGRKIWNYDVYNKLCSAVKRQSDQDYFPAYRFRSMNP